MSRTPAFAGAVAGLALWLSAGVLDAVDGASGATRVAMLPPFWMAAVYVLVGIVCAIGLAHAVASWAGDGRDASAADLVLPLFAAGLLALPFLPWLADLVPAWTTLASPFARLAWFTIAGLVVRAAVLRLIETRSPHTKASAAEGRTRWLKPAGVFIVTAAVCGGAATRLAGTPIFPGGDEPHYLVIAQSLWRDGDLRIENNHRRGDTLEYFARPLKPDYLTRGVDREIYSIHPVGVAYLLAPVYALGGYRGVVAFLVLLASVAATLAWRLAAQRLGERAATFGWAACALTAPWVFNSFTVYPEVPAALAVLLAFTMAVDLEAARDRRRLWLSMFACGAAIATLPWLSSKYALMGAALGLVAMARLWLPRWLGADDTTDAPAWSTRDRLIASIAAAVAPMVSGVGWLAFFQVIWGRLSPSAPYGSQHAMDLTYLVAGGPGLFFDQEYGVVASAPVLLIALAGIVGMLRRRGRDARLAIEIVAIGVSLLVTVAAFHIWWGGTAAVGRPLISALALLVVPCAWQIRAWSHSRPRMAAAWLLLLASLAMMATLALAQEGLLLVAERDGTSRLLSYWAPAWRLWSLAPSFVIQPAMRALLITSVWIASVAAALAVIGRMAPTISHGRASLAATGAAFVALTGVALAVAPIGGRESAAPGRPSDRARQPLLDSFDASRRPLALVFDPWHRVEPLRVPGLFRFIADPGTPRAAPALPLLLGARWAWPAGDYEVEITSAQPLRGELALQAGRAGPPLATWTLDGAGPRWQGRFSLPIDVGFSGFKGSGALAEVRPRIVVRPIAIVDASRRLPAADVVQSRIFAGAAAFFHDDNADPEPAGFWTRRDRLTRISLARSDGRRMALRVRSGPSAVRLTLHASCTAAPVRSCSASMQTIDLTANASREVPLGTAGPVRVDIETRGGFVPAEVDPASRDVRGLGCWIEVVDEP